jgi:hypothetical protein
VEVMHTSRIPNKADRIKNICLHYGTENLRAEDVV